MNSNSNSDKKGDKWTLCSKEMPDEHDSSFSRLYGTDNWRGVMYKKESKRVLVTYEYSDGRRTTGVSYTVDGKWKDEVDGMLLGKSIIAWREQVEPYMGKEI